MKIFRQTLRKRAIEIKPGFVGTTRKVFTPFHYGDIENLNISLHLVNI